MTREPSEAMSDAWLFSVATLGLTPEQAPLYLGGQLRCPMNGVDTVVGLARINDAFCDCDNSIGPFDPRWDCFLDCWG